MRKIENNVKFRKNNMVEIDQDLFAEHAMKLQIENRVSQAGLSVKLFPHRTDSYLNYVINIGRINPIEVKSLIENFGFPKEAFKTGTEFESKETQEDPAPEKENNSILAIEVNTATITAQNREIIKLLTIIANGEETAEPANIYPLIVSNAKPNKAGMNQNTLAAWNEIKQKRYTEIYLGSGQKSLSDQPHVMGILNLIARNGYTLVMTPALNEQGRPYIAVMLYNGDGNWPHGYKGADK